VKDKLLPEILGAALPCLLCPAWGGPEKTLTSPHKRIHSAWAVFLAKPDSSSVSKVASGECSLHQCELQNELIQAAASVWAETIASATRRAALLLGVAGAGGKQELFSLCARCVGGARPGRDAPVLRWDLGPAALRFQQLALPSCSAGSWLFLSQSFLVVKF